MSSEMKTLPDASTTTPPRAAADEELSIVVMVVGNATGVCAAALNRKITQSKERVAAAKRKRGSMAFLRK
jgi:hypothetical protein